MRVTSRNVSGILLLVLLGPAAAGALFAQSLDSPSKSWGISFGNSKDFTGLRFNFRDSRVERVTGLNVTLWRPRKDDQKAVITGLSPASRRAECRLRGIQLGILGAGADISMIGLTWRARRWRGDDLVGISVGGPGAGAGRTSAHRHRRPGRAGAGNNLTGIAIGGSASGLGRTSPASASAGWVPGGRPQGHHLRRAGAGAGENMTGLAAEAWASAVADA
jgi:hypothetical protein